MIRRIGRMEGNRGTTLRRGPLGLRHLTQLHGCLDNTATAAPILQASTLAHAPSCGRAGLWWLEPPETKATTETRALNRADGDGSGPLDSGGRSCESLYTGRDSRRE
ncbi:MAG: hypothetical protein ACO4AV_09545 [bacterium]